MAKLSSFFQNNRFGVISWVVTAVLVAGMVVGALLWKKSTALPGALSPIPTASSNKVAPQIPLPALAGKRILRVDRTGNSDQNEYPCR